MHKKKFFIKIFFLLLLALIIFSGFYVYYIIQHHSSSTRDTIIYIPTNSSYNDVIKILTESDLLKYPKLFNYIAKKKGYSAENGANIKPGKYRLSKRISKNKIKEFIRYNEIINILRAGLQEPVRVTFNNIRTKEQFAGRIAKYIEADSVSIINLLNDEKFVQKYGFNKETIFTMFIPNTYEMWWNTSAEQFFVRMAKEYEKFWTDERKAKLKQTGLTQIQVSILASIIEKETLKDDEKPRIAGVYINRLNKEMHLKADPTIIFALGDFSIKRVLYKHLQIESPYNTYKYAGLPPGPICMPSIASIDAVLYYEKHDYLYFCAKPDFSGYHNFAKTLAQHQKYAKEYQQALNYTK